MKKKSFIKRSIGILCSLILVIGMGVAMYLFEGARIGIPIGFILVAIVIGAAWGLSD